MQPADKVGSSISGSDDNRDISDIKNCTSKISSHHLLSRYTHGASNSRSEHTLWKPCSTMPDPQMIAIQPMSQQLLVQNAKEDWTGVTSTAERRKLQNRLNKRSQYLRKRQQTERRQLTSDIISQAIIPSEPKPPINSALQKSPDEMLQALLEMCEVFVTPEIRQKMFALASKAYLDYTMNAPRISHLPFLITLNVNIAIAKNATLLGFDRTLMCLDETISPFNHNGPFPPSFNPPELLEPTQVQREVLHHPWLDIFPFPRFRDNIIRAVEAGFMDDDDLCKDIAEANLDNVEKPSLIVWGDASLPHSWEASPWFVRKWGWLLQGCPEMLEATNKWRQSRGERLLQWNR